MASSYFYSGEVFWWGRILFVWRGRPKTSCCRFILCTTVETIVPSNNLFRNSYVCVSYYTFCCKSQRQLVTFSDRSQDTIKCAPLHMQSDYALTRNYTSDAMHKFHSVIFMHPTPFPRPAQTSLDHPTSRLWKIPTTAFVGTPEIRRADQYFFSSWCLN